MNIATRDFYAEEFLPRFVVTRGYEWQVWQRLYQTFSMEQVASILNVRSRTTVWKIEKQIVKPAIIKDFNDYREAHPKEIDFYCLSLFGVGWQLRSLTGSYAKANKIMKENYQDFSRKVFDKYIEVNIINKINGELNVHTKHAA